jgi:hypothetical protein
MRLAAALLLNPFTGFTPRRLFQTATRRSAGQLETRFRCQGVFNETMLGLY